MSKFRLLTTTLLVVLCTGFYSCSKEADSPIDEPQISSPKTYTVSFKLGGDFLTTSETPLVRANEKIPKKIYGINVYYKKEDNSKYENYGYGLFDNTEDMTISLITGYKYKFECTIVKENEDKLYQTENQYGLPFKKRVYGTESSTFLENKFIISTVTNNTAFLAYLKYGTADIVDYSYETYPKLDRYYGELIDYSPSTNGTVNIDLKRTSFGLKFIVTPPTDGNLLIDYGSHHNNINISANDEILESEAIYTFYDVYNCWKNQDCKQAIDINLTWNRANGATQTFQEKITVKRNIMTTVNINLTNASTDSSLGLKEEDTPMGNENIDIDINGGNQEDNPVNPSV